MSGQGFIGRCVEPARETQRMYGVPASVTIAQAILESGWGGSELATRANNYFGIKCAAVASPHQIGCIDKATWEHLNGNDVTMTASFRRYASMRDSFLDHGLFLTKPRYAAAFKAATPDEFARRIWQAGYATDPQYPAKLVRLMDQYELRQYDDPKQQEAPMPKVFLSPSDQDDNPVHGGGHEQQYAQARCARAAEVLRAHGVTVKVSEAGIGDDSNGYVASVKEGEAWGPDIYVADHTNATGNAAVKRSGVQAYCWLGDPNSKRLGECINARMDPIVPGGASIQDGSNLYEVSGPSATAVLMESGYHDNAIDAAAIRTKTTEMGEALALGILDYFGIQTTTPSEEEDIMSDPQTIDLLTKIAERTLVTADALTVGKEGVKFDGDVIARLRSIESKLDALATTEPERAEPEPEAPAETAPVTGATAIREALATARAALSIIEANL